MTFPNISPSASASGSSSPAMRSDNGRVVNFGNKTTVSGVSVVIIVGLIAYILIKR